MIDSTDEQIARLQTLLAEPPMKALGSGLRRERFLGVSSCL